MGGFVISLLTFVFAHLTNAQNCQSLASNPASAGSSLLQMVDREKVNSAYGRSAYADCALDVMIVIDTSSSILCTPGTHCSNWQDLTSSASQFIDQLKSTRGSRAGAITFDSVAQSSHLTSLRSDLDGFAAEIRSLSFSQSGNGATNIKAALDLARTSLEQTSGRRSVVLMFTDGEPTWSEGCQNDPLPGYQCAQDAARSGAQQVKNVAQLAMVAIGNANTNFMRSLASAQSFFPVQSFDELTQKTFINGLVEDICAHTQPPTPPSSPTPQSTPMPPSPTPPSPTPSTPCEKDTRAECESLNGLCFQTARGHTACQTSKIDGKRTCHCMEHDECVYNRTMPLTRGGHWGVCRKNKEEKRGEGNPVSWFFVISLDILKTYLGASGASSIR